MKLLPCPFCGGEPEEYGGMFFEFYGHERQDYSIACKKCRAEVRCDVGEHEGADAPCSCHHDTRKICAEKWNRRAAMLQGAEPVTTACKLSPHVYRELVNSLRDTAVNYQGCQQLREQIRKTLSQVITHTPHCSNSPVIPDGWVACSERMPEIGVDVLACTISPIGGFEEIETAQWHGGMKGEQPVFITSADAIEPTHWMTLPAAPQQEA